MPSDYAPMLLPGESIARYSRGADAGPREESERPPEPRQEFQSRRDDFRGGRGGRDRDRGRGVVTVETVAGTVNVSRATVNRGKSIPCRKITRRLCFPESRSPSTVSRNPAPRRTPRRLRRGQAIRQRTATRAVVPAITPEPEAGGSPEPSDDGGNRHT